MAQSNPILYYTEPNGCIFFGCLYIIKYSQTSFSFSKAKNGSQGKFLSCCKFITNVGLTVFQRLYRGSKPGGKVLLKS